jgi:hypothetical protein
MNMPFDLLIRVSNDRSNMLTTIKCRTTSQKILTRSFLRYSNSPTPRTYTKFYCLEDYSKPQQRPVSHDINYCIENDRIFC